jgi:hypothetical protein
MRCANFVLSGYPLHPSTSGWGPTIVSIGCRTDSNRLLGEAMKAQSPSVCAGNLSLGPGVSHVPSTNVTRLLNLGQRDTHFVLNPIRNDHNQQTQWNRRNAPKSLPHKDKAGNQMQNRDLIDYS